MVFLVLTCMELLAKRKNKMIAKRNCVFDVIHMGTKCDDSLGSLQIIGIFLEREVVFCFCCSVSVVVAIVPDFG